VVALCLMVARSTVLLFQRVSHAVFGAFCVHGNGPALTSGPAHPELAGHLAGQLGVGV
jgi:hypothetical protein